MRSKSNKIKQRRYIRYAIELKAVLVVDEFQRFECLLLDFCAHGLFLRITQANFEISLPKNVKIQFRIVSEQGLQAFEVAAQVMHHSGNGIGVLIDNMPLTTFNALKSQMVPGIGTSTDFDGSGRSQAYGRFKLFLTQALLELLEKLVLNFFEMLSQNLTRVNLHSEYFASRSELDDLVTTLKLNIETCTSEFCHSVVEQIDSITDNSQKKEDITSFDRPLSLVEKEDFEDWLNMSAVIRKLSNQYEDPINQVTRELSRIFGRSKTTINNPVTPAILCDCWREILLQFNLDNNKKKALYSCFGRSLFESLPVFYQQVDSSLKTQGSLVGKYLDDQAGVSNKRALNSGRSANRDGNAAASSRVNLTTREPYQPAAVHIVSKLFDILQEVSLSRVDEPGFTDASEGGSAFSVNNNYFDPNEICLAIAQLQQHAGDGKIHQNYAAFKNSLQDILKKLSDKPKVFSPNDGNRLNIYGKFFETLLNDSGIPSDLKPYFESIHLPLMLLPLQGNEFLESESNPAKNIINNLAVLGQAVNGHKTAKANSIKEFMSDFTGRIARDAPANPDIWLELEKEIDSFTKNIKKTVDSRINHIIEIHKGQQKLALAKQAIQDEIDKRIAGKAVPIVIPMLLDAGWRNLLVFAELNKEKQGDKIRSYLNVIDDLMFWLYEQDSVVRIQASSIQTTLTFIEDELSSSATTARERKQVLDELTALLLGSGNPKVRKPLQTIKVAKQNSDDVAQSLGSTDELDLLIEQLVVGDWLRIKHEHDWFEPMKLVWIGHAPAVYVFVNTEGLKSLQFNKAGLVTLFRQGSAEKTESLDLPLTERTSTSMLQNMHEKFVFNATHDPDTNLITRDEFIKQLKNEMPKLNQVQHVLCHIEVLDFRLVTNLCGLSGSQQMLKMITQRMADQLRTADLFARLGDKSFAILFKNCSTDEGYELSKQLIKLVGETHFKWQEISLPITLSIGLRPFAEDCVDVYQLLQQADAASLSAERSGRGNVLVFAGDDENLQYQNKLLEWIGQIDTVFSDDRLFARCQMIAPIEADKESHIHYEILLGIKDEEGNIIPPDHFIPAVERSKRMHEVDMWVVNTVFDWIEKNRLSFDSMDGFSINLSGQSLNSEEFLQFLQTLLEAAMFPVEKLVFEITETVASENLAFTKKFINAIKTFGCKFSLDDFGSGYSSYAYLKNLNVDFLKIDGAFVKELATNKADLAIVKSMNEIAHSLNLKTIAEYVESAEIKDVLKQIGVDYGQGYFIHKPMPLKELVVPPKGESELFYFEDNSFWEV
ncbi:DUF1631 family protein [Methylomonas sp. SURF-2]|uniref:DUF1631 family protein n=1 Tax=Methylomonas subterranea TaxID=2952225 RepID=A0ABT1TEV6_9GAMM|nr:DUF1631 family protein [Methylomonas sp. SURF-2]MCQ8103991.1 DUF1631 family protein [Methylomonas sp. SURF-2]